VELIHKYFNDLTIEQIKQFELLEDLYFKWNQKINVISRKDIDEIYLKHVLHSLAIAKFISFKDDTSIIDVGTGGGFPGIPLAIIFPKVKFHLVDSINKKILVVNEVSKSLKLKNVTTSHSRVENLNGKYDFVISRAVTKMREFKRLIKGKFNSESFNDLNNGIIYLKGGDLTIELLGIINKQISISKYFNEEFFETKKIVYVKN
jgi:16S rRNA (guanine527-N7)-methyltransferase|tara:strand:+ start:5499 stop:6113 length:615 start_codon:yes stop_codon:yes gene_type:complete